MAKVNNLKFFLFVTLFFGNLNVFAEESNSCEEMLKLGIKKSEIELVKKALSSFELNKKNKERFLILATERVEFRRDMLNLFLLGKSCGEGKPRKDNKSDYSLLIFFGSVGVLLYSASKDSGVGVSAGGLGILVSVLMMAGENDQSYKEIYDDAIEVRDLIIKA